MNEIQDYVISLLHDSTNQPNEAVMSRICTVLEFCLQNKISLLALSKLKSNTAHKNIFLSKEFIEACKDEYSKCQIWRDSFIQIKKEWDKRGIEFIFHKSAGQFPYMSDNLDILVRNKDFKEAGKILHKIGYIELRNIQEPHKKFYRKYSFREDWVPVHLHERVCWGVPYEDNDHMWNTYIISNEDSIVHFPCAEDILLVTTAHCFLEDHLVRVSDLLTIKKNSEGSNLNWEYIEKTAKNMHWFHALYTGFLIFDFLYLNLFGESIFPPEIIKKAKEYADERGWIKRTLEKRVFINKLEMPLKLPHLWTRIHSSLRILSDPAFGGRYKRLKLIFKNLFDGFIHLKLGLKSHPRFFVAFSGLDGSGKTAHCKALQKAFEMSDINAKYIWSRTGSLPISQSILKFIRIFKSKRDSSSAEKEKRLIKSKLFLKLWQIINSIDLILFYFFKLSIPLFLGKVIISDRYIADGIVDLESLAGSEDCDKPLYNILRFLTPYPDIMYFLELNPQAIIQRGRDEPEEQMALKYACYKSLLPETEAMWIDNSNPFHEVNEKISNITLTKFFSKYPDKYEGYDLVSIKYK